MALLFVDRINCSLKIVNLRISNVMRLRSKENSFNIKVLVPVIVVCFLHFLKSTKSFRWEGRILFSGRKKILKPESSGLKSIIEFSLFLILAGALSMLILQSSCTLKVDKIGTLESKNSDPGPPPDPLYPDDPIFETYGDIKAWGLEDIGAPEAWAYNSDCSGILIGVLDTGIDYSHEDLWENIWFNSGEIGGNGVDDDGNGLIDDVMGWDFVNDDNDPMDDNRHGTHVAGIIGAVGDNTIGISGVCWKAELVPIKVLDNEGAGTLEDIAEGIEYAHKNNVRITNNSYGAYDFEQCTNPATWETCIKTEFPLYYNSLKKLADDGSLFFAAAGNGGSDKLGDDNDEILQIPANFSILFPDMVVSVAAVDSGGSLTSFSNYGNETVNIAAPGIDIYSTVSGGYISYKGTSMATPFVTGSAALLKSIEPSLSGPEIVETLYQSSDKENFSDSSKVKSGGKLNLIGAVNLIW